MVGAVGLAHAGVLASTESQEEHPAPCWLPQRPRRSLAELLSACFPPPATASSHPCACSRQADAAPWRRTCPTTRDENEIGEHDREVERTSPGSGRCAGGTEAERVGGPEQTRLSIQEPSRTSLSGRSPEPGRQQTAWDRIHLLARMWCPKVSPRPTSKNGSGAPSWRQEPEARGSILPQNGQKHRERTHQRAFPRPATHQQGLWSNCGISRADEMP